MVFCIAPITPEPITIKIAPETKQKKPQPKLKYSEEQIIWWRAKSQNHLNQFISSAYICHYSNDINLCEVCRINIKVM